MEPNLKKNLLELINARLLDTGSVYEIRLYFYTVAMSNLKMQLRK